MYRLKEGEVFPSYEPCESTSEPQNFQDENLDCNVINYSPFVNTQNSKKKIGLWISNKIEGLNDNIHSSEIISSKKNYRVTRTGLGFSYFETVRSS